MKNPILTLLFVSITLVSNAQTATDSVKNAVNTFFEGMKKGDTTLIRSALTEGVIFQTMARTKEGIPTVRTDNVADFLKSIASLEKGAADERIEFGAVHIDGNLASVWTPYKFYFKGQFSHCGANSFQLVRLDGTWRIQYIIDTRRKKDCE